MVRTVFVYDYRMRLSRGLLRPRLLFAVCGRLADIDNDASTRFGWADVLEAGREFADRDPSLDPGLDPAFKDDCLLIARMCAALRRRWCLRFFFFAAYFARSRFITISFSLWCPAMVRLWFR